MRPLPYLSIAIGISSLCVLGAFALQAQERAAAPDTLASSRGPVDTTRRVSGVDTLVIYNARDSINYSLRTRYMNLYGKSDIKYRAIDLKAERIGVNWDTATLTAGGIPDTSDKGGKKYIGEPILMDGPEKYDGFKIGYNFQTKQGKISLAETEIEEGYYHGEEIKKVGPDVLFVEDGRYTTCSAEYPHFYFYSPRMKVIPREVVVAEPVYFYIADVPIFALPFGVFPNKSGRRSGLIAPAYGEDFRLGRYFSHFGYYWAISDYLDLASTFDWYTRGGWGNRSLLRYKLKYNFDGSISTSYNWKNQTGAEPGDPDYAPIRDYNVNVTHNQDIDPSANLRMNFTFSSSSYYRNFSTNLNEILRQNIVSNATFTKTWTESNRSLSVFVLRDQSLINGDVEENLPQVSFTQGSIFPFRRKSKTAGTDQAWYETIGLNYSAGLGNRRSKRSRVFDGVKSTTGETISVKEFQRTNQQSVNQNVSLSFSPRLGNFTVSPSLSFADARTFTEDRSPMLNPADSTLVFQTTGPKTTRGNLNAAVGLSTRFFGIMQPNILGITAFRHTVNPSLSFGYGKQVYGTTAGPSSMVGSINVQNLFEMKYQPSDTAKEQKIQLMNIGASINYNFRAPEFRLSELGVSYRTDIGQYFNISGGASYNFYLFDRALGRRVNKYLIKEKRYLADLTHVSLNISTSLSGERKGSTEQVHQPQEQSQQSGLGTQQGITQSYFQDQEPDFSIPWSLGLNLNFLQSQADPRQKLRSVSLQAQLSFNLTEQWKISASGNYDLVQKQFAAPVVNVSRDLHCWIMNFTWIPLGPYRSYRFEIRVKAPALQDIKITKQGSERGVYY